MIRFEDVSVTYRGGVHALKGLDLTVEDGEFVVINEAVTAGKNIRPAGIDFREGDVLLPRGSLLNDRALALAAGMNHPRLPVHRRPKVAILDDLGRVGLKVFERFKPSPEETLWYYRSLVEVYESMGPAEVARSLRQTVEMIEQQTASLHATG